MTWVKDFAEAVVRITQIEKLGIFSFTIILISLVIKQPLYFLGLALYSFSIIIYFLFIGFHRYEKTRTYPSENKEGRITEYDLGFDFSGRYRNVDFVKYVSIFFLIAGSIALVANFFGKNP
jgi:predicted membrane channel-forming protein YqfA (hemolysin III family)